VACVLCGSANARVRQPASYPVEQAIVAERGQVEADPNALVHTFSSSSDARLSHQLVECEECGLQYVNPRLRPDLVLEGYKEGSDEVFVSQARGRELTFAGCLDVIERNGVVAPGRLLDIGTGSASFPFVARDRGWTVEACEPNRWLCAWAWDNYRVRVQPGTVFEQEYAADTFDLVTLWDVLEHTADPRREVAEAHRLLKNAGVLVVNYPDIGSWIARAMGRSWVFLLDVHLYYFTRATIRRLLRDHAFEVIRMRPHYQRLALGYILHRASAYVGAPARLAGKAVAALGISEWQVPYWMGQTLVIARKSSAARG
jgi:2-polyprenyl-3-methyl-5-hydroxy-6-metoxy-1,4-benzoquinol methylase